MLVDVVARRIPQKFNIPVENIQVLTPMHRGSAGARASNMSVHKSQGSEYPVMVMPLLTQHYMLLQRNLLYTAITRAKKMVVVVGTRKAVAMAVKNNKISARWSILKERLQA